MSRNANGRPQNGNDNDVIDTGINDDERREVENVDHEGYGTAERDQDGEGQGQANPLVERTSPDNHAAARARKNRLLQKPNFENTAFLQ